MFQRSTISNSDLAWIRIIVLKLASENGFSRSIFIYLTGGKNVNRKV